MRDGTGPTNGFVAGLTTFRQMIDSSTSRKTGDSSGVLFIEGRHEVWTASMSRASLTSHHEHWAPTACRTVAVSARHYRRRRRNDRHHRDVVVRARTPPLAFTGRQSVTLS